jgi:putative endonuclease
MNREAAERFGRLSEIRAALWLNLHGWWIVASRLKTPLGEIDLIARRGRTVAFVEVKARKNAAELAEAIDEHRLRRVAAAAEAVAHRYVRPGDTMRIDVLLLAPRRFPHHIVNAWQP